jgi:hypothetical protein
MIERQGRLRGRPVCLSSWDFAYDVAHRKAVLRAMHSFARKWPQYALSGGNGQKPLVLYEPASELGALWARLIVERRGVATLIDARLALTAIHEEEPAVVAVGIARLANNRYRFWRVRRHPTGRWLVEALETGVTGWRLDTQCDTQQQAMSLFTSVTKPLPPGVAPPFAIPGTPFGSEEVAKRQELTGRSSRAKAEDDHARRFY